MRFGTLRCIADIINCVNLCCAAYRFLNIGATGGQTAGAIGIPWEALLS